MKNLIDQLGARALANNGRAGETPDDFELQIGLSLPPEFSSFLKEMRGPVVFDKGTKFIPSSPSGREDGEGFLDLDILYGATDGPNGLAEQYAIMKREDLPGFIPIGGSAGGDQICIERNSLKVVFWKHDSEEDEAISEVAVDVSHFLDALVPDPEESIRPLRKIVEKDSYLDF